jgi:predicted GIY-YIG superfamily endonuclease
VNLGHTTLYRLFSKEGVLLYVGIAGNPGRRFEEHHGDKAWWGEVNTSKMEHFSTRELALKAEWEAIRRESPKYNIVYNLTSRQPTTSTGEHLEDPLADPTRDVAIKVIGVLLFACAVMVMFCYLAFSFYSINRYTILHQIASRRFAFIVPSCVNAVGLWAVVEHMLNLRAGRSSWRPIVGFSATACFTALASITTLPPPAVGSRIMQVYFVLTYVTLGPIASIYPLHELFKASRARTNHPTHHSAASLQAAS